MVGQQGAGGQQFPAGVDVGDDLTLVHRHIHIEIHAERRAGEVPPARGLEPGVQEGLEPPEGGLELVGQVGAVGVQIHVPEAQRRAGGAAQVRVPGVHGGGEIEEVPTLPLQEGQHRRHVQVGLELVHAAVALHLHGQTLPQVPHELVQVGPAVVFEDVDELGHVPQGVGGDGGLPVVVVDEVPDVAAQGQLLLVVAQPYQGDPAPVVAPAPQGEVGLGLPVGAEPPAAVGAEEPPQAVPGPVFGPLHPPGLPPGVDGLGVDPEEAVQLAPPGVPPQGDHLVGGQAEELQPPRRADIGLEPGHPRFHRIPPQGLHGVPEPGVKELLQGLSIGPVLRLHRPGPGQEVAGLLVHQLFVDGVLQPDVGAPRPVAGLALHVGAVAVVGVGLQQLPVPGRALKNPDLLADDLMQAHGGPVRVGQGRAHQLGLCVCHLVPQGPASGSLLLLSRRRGCRRSVAPAVEPEPVSLQDMQRRARHIVLAGVAHGVDVVVVPVGESGPEAAVPVPLQLVAGELPGALGAAGGVDDDLLQVLEPLYSEGHGPRSLAGPHGPQAVVPQLGDALGLGGVADDAPLPALLPEEEGGPAVGEPRPVELPEEVEPPPDGVVVADVVGQGVGGVAPVQPPADVVEPPDLLLGDGPQRHVGKHLAAGARHLPQVFPGVGLGIGQAQVLGLQQEGLSQPGPGHRAVVGPVHQGPGVVPPHILVAPVPGAAGRVEGVEEGEVLPAPHQGLVDGPDLLLPLELVGLLVPGILDVAPLRSDGLELHGVVGAPEEDALSGGAVAQGQGGEPRLPEPSGPQGVHPPQELGVDRLPQGHAVAPQGHGVAHHALLGVPHEAEGDLHPHEGGLAGAPPAGEPVVGVSPRLHIPVDAVEGRGQEGGASDLTHRPRSWPVLRGLRCRPPRSTGSAAPAP
nr:MAG TPA: hypothetical protein [Caudoviricetes sp.]